MEHCPPPTVNTPSAFHYTHPSSASSQYLYQSLGITDSTTNLVLKSEDKSIDEELLNVKLERLRLLGQIRELETSSIGGSESPVETPPDTTSSDEYSTADDASPTTTNQSSLTDEDIAKKLIADELATLKKTGKTQEQIQRDITQQVETLMKQDPKFAQNLSNLEKDENLARLIERQYLQNINFQIEQDERLARKLFEEEQNGYITIPGSNPVNNTIPGRKPRRPVIPARPVIPGNNFPMNKTSPEIRKHAVDVHNTYCNCKKVTPGNNGHIFKLHDEYCACIKLHPK